METVSGAARTSTTRPSVARNRSPCRKTAPRGNNWGYVEQPEFDAFSDRIRAEFDPAKQDQVVAEMHTRMVDECVWLWVVHDMNPRAMNARVKGFVQAQNWFQDFSGITMSP